MRKLLFDQNLSYRIIAAIKHIFPQSEHVSNLKLNTADDKTVWEYAKNNNFHIVSKDGDFNNMSSLYGFPPKVIWIQTGNTTTSGIIELLKSKHEVIFGFLDNEQKGILELSSTSSGQLHVK